MILNTSRLKNIIFLLVILLFILPQTRKPIQVLIHKGLALFSPSLMEENSRINIDNYEWQLIDSNGHPFNFTSAENRVVIINFWATWCPPCIAEMPNFEKLFQDYSDKVLFLFVSNESPEKVNAFINKNEYSFPVYSSLEMYPEIFDVQSIPKTYVIDKKGFILIDKVGAANWNSSSIRTLIDELLVN
jgi:thiol-disulfide isomerase/thioredoxin